MLTQNLSCGCDQKQRESPVAKHDQQPSVNHIDKLRRYLACGFDWCNLSFDAAATRVAAAEHLLTGNNEILGWKSGQREGEGRSFPQRALDMDRSTHGLYEVPHN